jgi:hypothetical protein
VIPPMIWLCACKEPVDTDKGDPEPTAVTGATGDTGATDTGTRPGADLVAGPRHNYSLTQSFTLPQLEVRAEYDALLVRWSAVTVDAWGDPLVPSEVQRLQLLEITVPPSEVAERLANDDLGFDLLSTWEADVLGEVFVPVTDLHAGSTPFDPSAFLLEDPARSWVLALVRPVGDRVELLTATILVPTVASTNVAAAIEEGASFTWSGALDGEPLVTADEWDTWTLDWAGLTTDVFGRPYDDRVVNELFVARFPGTPGSLAPELRDLGAAADAVWRLDVATYTDARLELARDEGGGTFPGFTTGSTWVLGGRCTTCATPFPAFAFTVDVR